MSPKVPAHILFKRSSPLRIRHNISLLPEHSSNLTRLTATMKYLAVALLLCALLSLSKAHCFVTPVTPGMTHCRDALDNTWHAVGSSWRSQCYDCTCEGCCAAYSTPQVYPPDCVSEFDKHTCTYRVHKRDDPTVNCKVFAAVGK